MVRLLSDERDGGGLRQEHLEMAQHVIGQKCTVGFTDRLEESVRQFAKFLKWDDSVALIKVRDCLGDLLAAKEYETKSPFGWRAPVSKHPKYGEGSTVWEILEKKYDMDVELHKYSNNLFNSQSLYVARL